MAVELRHLIGLMEDLAPPRWAESWDSVGLQVGDPGAEVSSVLVALDVTDCVLDQAQAQGAELIVVHHPLLFHPLAEIRTDAGLGRRLGRLLAESRGVYAAHTNWDAAPQVGPAAVLAEALGLRESRPLLPLPTEERLKLVTFLPVEDVPRVRRALAAAGAGVSGDYRECSFQVVGEGHFRAPADAHPAVGEAGAENVAPEARLEMVLPVAAEAAVVGALLATHPYETPAWEVYPLRTAPSAAGYGRVGELPEALTLEELAERVRQAVGGGPVLVAGEGSVRRVAVLPGSGGSGVEAARAAGAQGYVTGELDYHRALEAAEWGLSVVAAGHAETEAPALPRLAEALREALGDAVRVDVARAEPRWRAL